MRTNVYPLRLDDKELFVVREFANAYTGGNMAAAIRMMILEFGRSCHLLTDKDVLELERSRYQKFPIPLNV